jgi:anti-sigma B factor antagonist
MNAQPKMPAAFFPRNSRGTDNVFFKRPYSMSWDVKERQAGAVTILELNGRLTMGAGSEALYETMKQLTQAGRAALLLDCRQVEAIDSQGIQTILRGQRLAREGGGKLVLLKVSARMREALTVTRLLPVIEHSEDEQEALGRFAG